MGAGQVADAHEELAHDLTAGEPEVLLEQLHPFLFRQRMMDLEPGVKAAVGLPQLEDPLRVGDSRVHLEPVADDPRVVEQAPPIPGLVTGYNVRIEPVIRLPKRLPFLEDREPGESRLVDLQNQPLKQIGVAREGEAVLVGVIGTVPFVGGGEIAVGGHFGFLVCDGSHKP